MTEAPSAGSGLHDVEAAAEGQRAETAHGGVSHKVSVGGVDYSGRSGIEAFEADGADARGILHLDECGCALNLIDDGIAVYIRVVDACDVEKLAVE